MDMIEKLMQDGYELSNEFYRTNGIGYYATRDRVFNKRVLEEWSDFRPSTFIDFDGTRKVSFGKEAITIDLSLTYSHDDKMWTLTKIKAQTKDPATRMFQSYGLRYDVLEKLLKEIPFLKN